MTRTLFSILFFLIIITAIAILQIFMSKTQNKWLGLILPAISVLFSIMSVLGITSFALLTEQSGKTILNTVQIPKVSILLTALYVFALYNIPTAILLGIYYACREKIKKNSEIEKMSVQDLE